jgi:Ca-activated chloride channel homolog
MNFNPDDAKWTAYVMGELSDAESAQVEREMESSAAAREVVEEIRLAMALLKSEFSKEPAADLSAWQRRAVLAAASSPARRPIFRWAAVAASVAAGVIVVATISLPRFVQPREGQTPVAPATTPDTASPQTTTPTEVPLVQKKVQSAAAVPAERKEEQPTPVPLSAVDQSAQIAQAQTGTAPAAEARSGVVTGVLNGALPGQARTFTLNRLADSKRASEVNAPPPPPPASMAPRELADRVERPRFNTEAYDFISDNPFVRVAQDPRATFSIDVDTASYANIRRFLTNNQMPPKDSVRIEEMINYFAYDYASPTGSHPIAAYTEVAAAPWKPDHRLVRIGIKAREVDMSRRPPSNLVFLVDVSASMATPEKLPMLKSAMKLMVERLSEGDHVAIVTYAGVSGLRLSATAGDRKNVINAAIDGLESGGGTNGSAGIVLAYETAMAGFIRGGINRVILATDGDFNIGVTNQGDLTRLIEEKAKSGVFLSVLGFGMGNYKDSTLEKLADEGNGNYAYIDTLNEARKVLVEEMSGTLLTVAKDVKIQVEFNPAQVNAYRLIGYENRALRAEDFNDDMKDAGDMGAGHTVTALFEVVPTGVEIQIPGVDPLKYQQPAETARRAPSGEIMNLKIRYKDPEGNTSQLMESPVIDRGAAFNTASTDFRFASAVASFGMVLRQSPHRGQSTLDSVIDIAEKSRGSDRNGYREELLKLVRKARTLNEIR